MTTMLFASQAQNRIGQSFAEGSGASLPSTNLSVGSLGSELNVPLQQNDRIFSSRSLATSNTTPIASATFADLAGNDLANARVITVGSTPSRFSDWIGSTDTNDYYRFTLGANSNFNLSLTGLSNDADVQLLDSNGGVIRGSTFGGNLDESIMMSGLAAGTYFVRVYQYSNDTRYILNLSSAKPSNVLPTENNLAMSGSVGDFINNSNTTDTYRFELTQLGGINLSLTELSNDVNVRLIRDANRNGIVDAGEEILRSANIGNSNETISTGNLNPGSYFVQVYQGSGSSSYKMTYSTGLVVDTLQDENDGNLSIGDVSLREAIAFSNNGGSILFAPNLTGTITLNMGELVINKSLKINGPGADRLTISGNNTSRVFQVSDGTTSNRINVTIQGLTIADGSTSLTGAGILNLENLTVRDSAIRNNQSVGFSAGIANSGTLKLVGNTISDNTIQNFPSSGGLFTSGGGIANLPITGDPTIPILEIYNSTISGNKANRGGGIFNSGSNLKITNSTISGNESSEAGGGIRILLSGTVEINSSTITNNKANIVASDRGNGGGVSVIAGNSVIVKNSIIAGNQGNQLDVEGNFISSGSNLIGNLNGSTGFNASEDLIVPISSVIYPILTYNGGSTLTHALISGSPAINAGNNADIPLDITDLDGDRNTVELTPFDQRGARFARLVGSRIDIGAFEAQMI